MEDNRRRLPTLFILPVALFVASAAFPALARAQCNHGVSIFKSCESPKRTCASDTDCTDGTECTNDVCDPQLSNVTNCVITVSHADTCGDTTKIVEAFDIQDFAGDNVRVPAVGNLPIDSVIGNAVCCPGPSLPCFVGPAGSLFVVPAADTGCGNLPLPGNATAGSVLFRQNTYVVQANDPDPLLDQGNVRVQDLCNAGVPGCSMGANNLQFGAATDLVSGCTNPPSPDSTPCTDNDGTLCTTAGCNGLGTCDQSHQEVTCASPTCQMCVPQTGQCVPIEPEPPECDLNHFQCYEVDRPFPEPFAVIPGVTLDDRYGPGTVDVVRPKRLCAPADKEGEDPGAPSDADHLVGYQIKQRTPKFQKVPNQQVTNQFGSITITVIKPDRLFVPTSKSLTGPPPPLTTPLFGHFKCYRVRGAKFRRAGIPVEDQFGLLTEDVKKPFRLCAPADKNGEGTVQTPDLLCYKVRESAGVPRFEAPGLLFVNNQFGAHSYGLTGLRELCVPSTVTSGP